MQSPDQVKKRLISQIINDVPIILPKLLRYFGGAHISVSFVLSSPVRAIHHLFQPNFLF